MPNFALINSQCEPRDIVQLMSDIFHRYDRLIDIHGVGSFVGIAKQQKGSSATRFYL